MEQHGHSQIASVDQLNRHRRVHTPAKVHRDRVALKQTVTKALGRTQWEFLPELSLSARNPFDPLNGQMDVYMPGRWDSSLDLVFMEHIVTGANPGEWNGSVAYVEFKAQANGDHFVSVQFSGYQTTMELHGPWGTASAYTATPADTGYVGAVWVGGADESLFFTVNSRGPDNLAGIGYLSAVEVYYF